MRALRVVSCDDVLVAQAGKVEWRILGEVDAVIDDEPVPLGGPRQRAVAAYLSLHAPQIVRSDQLIDAVWGEEPPKTARNSVHRFIADIRKALGTRGDLVQTVSGGYRLDVDPDQVDANRVSTLIATAQAATFASDHLGASAALREALGVWRTTALAGLDAAFVLPVRTALEEERLRAIEALFTADLELGRHHTIIGEVEDFAAQQPFRERAWQLVMLARYRCGQQVEALAAYDQLRSRMVEEFGLEPTPETSAVQAAVLQHADWVQRPTTDRSDVVPAVLGGLTARLVAPLPAALARTHLTPFVGRRVELELGASIIEPPPGSHATVTLIAGEPGIGKTRLASELAAIVHAQGVSVTYGRCDEEFGRAYEPWRTVLSQLWTHASPSMLDAHTKRFGGVISQLAGMLPDGQRLASDSDQVVLLQSVVDLIDTVAHGEPLLIVLDDLQWADPSSIQLLRYVALHTTAPARIIGLFRDTEVDADHRLSALVGTLQTDAPVNVIELAGLDAGAAGDLASSILDSDAFDGVDSFDHVAETVQRVCNGNPYFLTELLHGLVGAPLDTGATLSALPSDVRRVVEQRVARLERPVGEVLAFASAFGREFDLDVLAAAVGDDEVAVLGQVEQAIAAGLLNDAPAGRDRFAFTHDIVHQSLLAGHSTSRASRVHAAIADALQRRFGDELDRHAGEIAKHLLAADDPAQWQLTLSFCRRAGDEAAKSYAPTDAAEWFARCVDLQEARQQVDTAVLAEDLVLLGSQQRDAGVAGGRETLLRASQLAASIGAIHTQVAAALANGRGVTDNPMQVDEDRIGALTEALEAVGSIDRSRQARLLAMLAFELRSSASASEVGRLFDEAVALARGLDDPPLLADVYDLLLNSPNHRPAAVELQLVVDELDELCATQLVDPTRLMSGLTAVLFTAVQLGQADRVSSVLDRIWELERRVPIPRCRYSGQLGRVMAAGLIGDAAEYERLAVETFEQFADWGDEERTLIFAGHLYYTRYLQGRMGELVDAVLGMIASDPDGDPLFRAVLSLMYCETGQLAEASNLIDAELQRGFDQHVSMWTIQANTIWAGAAATVGHVAACEVMRTWLEPFSGQIAGHLVQVTEPVDISLGRASMVLGHFDAAVGHFDIAARVAAGFDAVWMVAKVDVARGQLAATTGSRKDAVRWAQQALDVARTHGFAAIEREATLVISAATTP